MRNAHPTARAPFTTSGQNGQPHLLLAAGAKESFLERRRLVGGFSLVELVITLVIALILMAISIPLIQSLMSSYKLRSAVSSATWAIQRTRYQAIMKGYPYQITFDPATASYQVYSQPSGATAFSTDGPALPLGDPAVSISSKTTLQFRPNGFVQATVGQMSFSISYKGQTNLITVSTYGDITVSR